MASFRLQGNMHNFVEWCVQYSLPQEIAAAKEKKNLGQLVRPVLAQQELSEAMVIWVRYWGLV